MTNVATDDTIPRNWGSPVFATPNWQGEGRQMAKDSVHRRAFVWTADRLILDTEHPVNRQSPIRAKQSISNHRWLSNAQLMLLQKKKKKKKEEAETELTAGFLKKENQKHTKG